MIAHLLEFLSLTEETRQLGPEIWNLVEPNAQAIMERFYAQIRNFHVNPHLSVAITPALIAKQKAHWATLFGGHFNDDYANSVRRIGIRHREIGLDLKWYVLSYEMLKIAFIEVLVDSALPQPQKGRMIKALAKFVALDVALALSPYEAELLD